jgi:MoaA/NifB/PqqE/SkfB family radical SAM enzyme
MISNPEHLQVELTNYCNLACLECPHHKMERPLAHMSEEVFSKFLDMIDHYEAGKPLRTIILHKDGEPLMNPKFLEYYGRIAEHTKAKLDLYTNGCLLTPEIAQRMHDVSPDNHKWILVSMHQFKHDGTKYDLSEVERNLLECVKLRLPKIEYIIAMHKLDQTDDRDTTEFYIKWTNIALQYGKAISAVHVNTSINHWAGRVKQQQEMAHFYTCPYMDAAHLFIGNTGNILPCCIDRDEEILLGNILRDPMEVIMMNRQLFYEKLNAREVEHPLCSRCLE